MMIPNATDEIIGWSADAVTAASSTAAVAAAEDIVIAMLCLIQRPLDLKSLSAWG